MPTTSGIAGIALRKMLEHQRLALRDRRVAAVIDELRARARAYESTPLALKHAIADFADERDALRRRLDELERAARPPTPPGGRARA